MRIAITGTPGVGKHTITNLLAKRLNVKVIDINILAFKNNAIIGKDYASIVDIDKMKKILKHELSNNCIVIGHLVPYVLDEKDIDYVVVVRRSPYELERVYIERGYDNRKMKDNLSSEILGMIAYDCITNFNNVVEVDCSNKKPEDVVNEIIDCIKNKKYKIGIDWLEVIKDDINRFFDL